MKQFYRFMSCLLIGSAAGLVALPARAQSPEPRCDHPSLVADPKSVIPVCTSLLMGDGHDAKTRAGLLYILGRGYHRSNRIAEAIENYDAAIALDRSSADLFVSRAWAAMEVGDGDRMLLFAQEAINADPTSARAWDLLGAAYAAMGQAHAALEAYDHALRIDPRFGLALLHRGQILIRLGQTQAAVEAFEAILALPPEEVETGNLIGLNGKPASFRAAALEERANARWNSAPFDVVEADLRAAIAMELSPFRHQRLARHFRRQPGRIEDAVRAIRAAHEMAPYLVPLQHELGQYLLRAGLEEEGMAEVRRVIDKAPGFLEAYITLVKYLRLKNRTDEAIAVLEAGYNVNPPAFRWLVDRMIQGGFLAGHDIPAKATPEFRIALQKCFAARCA